MLNKVKAYFCISDTSSDDLIKILIDNAGSLLTSYGIAAGDDSPLLFSMVVEDYSNWLKSGNGSYEVAQVSTGIMNYSDCLQRYIRSSAILVAR